MEYEEERKRDGELRENQGQAEDVSWGRIPGRARTGPHKGLDESKVQKQLQSGGWGGTSRGLGWERPVRKLVFC